MSHARSQQPTRGRRGDMLDRRDACPTSRRAFTLIEALISVAVLLVIILFTSKIFSSVSRVTGAGQGNADIMTEIAAIEQQVRRDFERLSREGYLSIISRAVRNDINDPTRSGMGAGTDPRFWLDPERNATDYIRSDRIVFFTQGVSTGQHYVPNVNVGDNRKAQTNVARVYYGHGFQLGAFPRLAGASAGASIDPNSLNNFDFPPWDIGNNGTVVFENNISVDGFFQPPAPRWTLARQNVLLGDDGGGPTRYLGQGLSTDSIWNFEIRNSRADVAATQLNDLRRIITDPANRWTEQQDLMMDSMLYPRAEAVDLTSSDLNVDKTLHVLGTAVSDFMIDWTYENGTGFTPDPNDPNPPNNPYRGVEIAYAGETPWFGLPDRALGAILARQDRGVFMLDTTSNPNAKWRVDPRGPVFPDQIEFLQADLYGEMTDDLLDISYVATFGYNQTRPLNPRTGQPWLADDRNTYTPWPSALRFTMRVHDPGTRLPRGRLVQFVITLPKRTK